MSSYTRYFQEKPDVKATFRNIVDNVHCSMRSVKPRRAVPSIPGPIAHISEVPTSNRRSAVKLPQTNMSRRMEAGQSRAPNVALTSIPQAKANLERKTRQMMRRGVSGFHDSQPSYQKRINEVLQQKSVLQDMLQEHKKLQRDRANIAMDIQRMRNDLDKIREKLDVSLQCLKSTKTVFGALPAKTMVRSNHPAPGATRRTGGNVNKSRSSQVRSGSVITKRQHHVASSSTRRSQRA